MSFEIEEVDEEETLPPPVDLNEYRKRKAYQEFWADPCWAEEPGPLG